MRKNLLYERGDQLFVRPATLPGLELKEIGGRWIANEHAWRLPNLVSTVEALKRLYGLENIEVSEELALRLGRTSTYGFELRKILSATVVQPGIRLFQADAVHYLLSSPHHGSLLCLAPRLGKTITSITAAEMMGANQILVIASTPRLIPAWEGEIKKWGYRQLPITRAHGSQPGAEGWTITNYETVVNHLEWFEKKWDVIIADESLKLMNRKAKRTVAVRKLSRLSKKIWLLSGSPTSKYIDDLFAQLEILDPVSFTSYWRFVHMYCYTEQNQWGTKVVGTRTTIDPKFEFRDLMFVRHFKDVLPEMPPYIFETVKVDLTPEQDRVYGEVYRDFYSLLESGEEISVQTKLTQLTRLQQITSSLSNFETDQSDSGKLEVLVDLIGDDAIPRPCIVWGYWSDTLKQIEKRLKKEFPKMSIARVDGSTTDSDEVIWRFQQGQLDFLVLSSAVGKYGFTLPQAQSMVYFDKTWDADAYIQSLARVEHLDRTHSPLVLTLFANNSTDALIEAILESKALSIARISNADLQVLLGGLDGRGDRNG